jgi:hypothetical protein
MNSTTSLPNSLSAPLPPRRSAARLWAGLSLASAGALALFTLSPLRPDNWWAVFILLPGLAGLAAAAWAWQGCGWSFNWVVRLNLFTSLPVLTVALIFLWHINWNVGWTLMLIVPGLVLLLNGFTSPRLPLGSWLRSLASLVGWVGLSTAALGATFFLNQAGFIHLALLGELRWWAAFILLPGLGALLSGLRVWLGRGRSEGLWLLALAGVWLVGEAICEFMGLNAQWYVAVMVTLSGLVMLGQAVVHGER